MRASPGILLDADGNVIFDGEAEAMDVPPFKTRAEIEANKAKLEKALTRAWHSLAAHARGRRNSDSPAALHFAASRPTTLPARTAGAAVAAAADATERVRPLL
jgi:hypothetical protein